ncbi:XRE family transcriptional regulator [Parashewanella curva]|uniref:XRE family transcriptional regulator n=1 Tax=Parashewanella curva TaxID=2338552 RepID=A0A3L8PXV2_9GAMM|nr:helix-turn-helix transcriptional regulator [Parashewanella curva]RLV59453.1 XRE family transcriptional regulator [Parashewanella curva]
MDVNAKTIKEYRLVKGWTQQHLAEICGVSLRTIQRVERYGTASNDTAMGIASAFEIDISEIINLVSTKDMWPKSNNKLQHYLLVVVSLLVGMALGAGMTLFLN